MEIKAEIVLGSQNEFGNKIVTWKLTFPRIVLSEFNTHRMISKNSASSRAIPFETLVNRVLDEPFIPIKWQRDHKGMQGSEELYLPTDIDLATRMWLEARDTAVEKAKALHGWGNITKQLVNRLLEPFMWHTVIATGTEWENFFALRAHHMAEIHIQDLAYRMLDEYNKYEFQQLKAGEWHIPFKEIIDEDNLYDWYIDTQKECAAIPSREWYKELPLIQEHKAKISAGVCAGISYGRIKDKIDIADMIDLHDSLVIRPYSGKRGVREVNDPIHASPTEHQAKAMDTLFGSSNGWSGNFRGFIQYRKTLENENAKDNRIKHAD